MELRGWINYVFEFGMEGSEMIFQDEAHFDSPSSDYQREGVHWLSDGDILTILNPDGSILWHGTLPADVESDVWHGWFRSDPPLRAILRKAALRRHQSDLADD